MQLITRWERTRSYLFPISRIHTRNVGKETLTYVRRTNTPINGTPFDETIDPFLLPATKTNIILAKFTENSLGRGIHLLLLNNEEKKIEDFLPLQPSKLNLIVHQPSFSRPRFAFVSFVITALRYVLLRLGPDTTTLNAYLEPPSSPPQQEMWVRIEIVFADEPFIGTKKYRVTRPFIAGLRAWQALYCRWEITVDSNCRCKVSPRKGKIIVASPFFTGPTIYANLLIARVYLSNHPSLAARKLKGRRIL